MEKKAVLSLSAMMMLRMLGLFMIYPVFAVQAGQYTSASPSLIGLAMGAYGFAQALCQFPMGYWSDRFGRRQMIAVGLGMLLLGSLICALSHSIYAIILGRALQGAGAVGSVVMASIADVTQEHNRTKAMAVIGMMIGLSFGLALFLGPLLSRWFNLAGIFWFTAIGSVAALILLYTLVPTLSLPQKIPGKQVVLHLLKNTSLIRLNTLVFILHAILTASFLALPVVLSRNAFVDSANVWRFYWPVLLLAFLAAVPLIVIAEKKARAKACLIFSFLLILVAEFFLISTPAHLWVIELLLFLFFTAFTALEALLPSLISKTALPEQKGTAMGLYSTFQFSGIFIGGVFGGLANHWHPEFGVFILNSFLAAVGFIVTLL